MFFLSTVSLWLWGYSAWFSFLSKTSNRILNVSMYQSHPKHLRVPTLGNYVTLLWVGEDWSFVTRRYKKTRVGWVLLSERVTKRLHFSNLALFDGLYPLDIIFINLCLKSFRIMPMDTKLTLNVYKMLTRRSARHKNALLYVHSI